MRLRTRVFSIFGLPLLANAMPPPVEAPAIPASTPPANVCAYTVAPSDSPFAMSFYLSLYTVSVSDGLEPASDYGKEKIQNVLTDHARLISPTESISHQRLQDGSGIAVMFVVTWENVRQDWLHGGLLESFRGGSTAPDGGSDSEGEGGSSALPPGTPANTEALRAAFQQRTIDRLRSTWRMQHPLREADEDADSFFNFHLAGCGPKPR